MTPEELDSEQRVVVDWAASSHGRALVVGGAGSGKTTTALCTTRAFLERSETPDFARALFLTFSRAAVSQILSRGRIILAGYEHRVEVLTFHALAFRLLRDFGRYDGLGTDGPHVQSPSRAKLFGKAPGNLAYDDIIPRAIELLGRYPSVLYTLQQRWPLIICDEVQDTNPIQWEIVDIIGKHSTLLLLGDPDQMIYTFVEGVSPSHFQSIAESVDATFQLPDKSHRDPSGLIPALSRAIRNRRFDDDSFYLARDQGRLRVAQYSDHAALGIELAAQVQGLRTEGIRDIAIFAHTNATTAEVGRLLHEQGISHELVGIPEAHAEGLNAMMVELRYAMGSADDGDVREALACFLTASTRGRDAPELALALLGGALLPPLIETNVTLLLETLRATDWPTVEELLGTVAASWPRLGFVEGTIIDGTTFMRAKALLEAPGRRERGRPTEMYRLRGRLRCWSCNTPMTGQTLGRGRWRYYRCRNSYTNTVSQKCDERYVPRDLLERAVFDEIIDVLTDPARLREEIERTLEPQPVQMAVVDATKALAHIEEQQKRLTRLFVSGELPDHVLNAEARRLQAEHNQLEQELKRQADHGSAELAAAMLDRIPGIGAHIAQWVRHAQGDDLDLLLRAPDIHVKACRERALVEASLPILESVHDLDLVTIERTSACLHRHAYVPPIGSSRST